jgi:hypothetical protein
LQHQSETWSIREAAGALLVLARLLLFSSSYSQLHTKFNSSQLSGKVPPAALRSRFFAVRLAAGVHHPKWLTNRMSKRKK